MRIELARGPCDGETITIDRSAPVFREDPMEAGMFCLYTHAGYSVPRDGGPGKPPKQRPIYEFVVRLTGEEMQQALAGAGQQIGRILRAD